MRSTTTSIVDLLPAATSQIDEIASFLFECFRRYSPSWVPDIASCKAEVMASFHPQQKSRVLLDSQGQAIGWIGAIQFTNLWEIHPIAVDPSHQGHGHGRLLVDDIVSLARAAGAVSVWAGTGDETQVTGFSHIELPLPPDIDCSLLAAPADHPVNFWRHMGFNLVAVTPDDGPDVVGIHFAKNIEQHDRTDV